MKVVFDLAAGRLAIEGDGPDLLRVLEAARTLAPNVRQIQIITAKEEPKPGSAGMADDQPRPAQPASASKTLRQFARDLSLGNLAERIAAIGYYVNKIEGKPSFSPKDIDGWFTMCGFQKPSQMSVALFDTKRKYGYAENVGHALWRISNQGENLIIAKIEESNK